MTIQQEIYGLVASNSVLKIPGPLLLRLDVGLNLFHMRLQHLLLVVSHFLDVLMVLLNLQHVLQLSNSVQ